jgi:DNA-binding winged helix-turn-helix (wHTH) protein
LSTVAGGDRKCNFSLKIIPLTPIDGSCTAAPARIALQPQIFDLLIYLVKNRDRVVSKDDAFSKLAETGCPA